MKCELCLMLGRGHYAFEKLPALGEYPHTQQAPMMINECRVVQLVVTLFQEAGHRLPGVAQHEPGYRGIKPPRFGDAAIFGVVLGQQDELIAAAQRHVL